MLTIKAIFIILSLQSGPDAARTMVQSLNTTVQAPNGDYVVTYQGPKSTHAPKRNAAHFAADEGANGLMPRIEHKSL